jgi:phosphatidate phosphatase APP1
MVDVLRVRHHRLGLALVLLAGAATSLAADLDPDEELLLFPTSARLTDDGDAWLIPIHAWVFEPEASSAWRAVLVSDLETALHVDPLASPLFARRVRLLLADGERGKRVAVQVAGEERRLGPSDSGGHVMQELRVPLPQAATLARPGRLPVRVATGDGRAFEGEVLLIASQGVSVISDVDDTIKDSRVLDRTELLANTFLRPSRAVPGMPQLYRRWAAAGAAFHYVSASPWQLYPTLSELLREHGFPAGSVDLRTVRRGVHARELLSEPTRYKLTTIAAILERYPKRRFILVGDTGERDPEVYATVAARFPDQVLHIALRRVVAEGAELELPAALTRLPPALWTIFSDPAELEELGRLVPSP